MTTDGARRQLRQRQRVVGEGQQALLTLGGRHTAGKADALSLGVGKLAVRNDKRVVWQGAFSRGLTDAPPSGTGETRYLLNAPKG